MKLRRLKYWMKVLVKGHLLNPLWKSRLERRRLRGRVIRAAAEEYLRPYVSVGTVVPDGFDRSAGHPSGRRVFSLWLQGEPQAPPLVRSCLDSIRRNAGAELVVLDEHMLPDWIELPAYVMDKWRAGKIIPAHFADICRIELLYRHGGVWMDATDYLPTPLPEWLWETPFFVYQGGDTIPGAYSGIQNCFIRGEKGSRLLGVWRAAVLAYWAHEDSALDYFMHQMLFGMAVRGDAEASVLYAQMPFLIQDSTHEIWYRYADAPYDEALFRDICSKALFQKTNYKSASAVRPVPGSFAEHLLSAR